MAKIITLTAESSGGKDTIFKKVLELGNVTPIISTTSRPMRESEQQGIEYNFVSYEEANKLIKQDKFIEKRLYEVANGDTWIYGITKDSIDLKSDNVYLAILDGKGLDEITNYIHNKGYRNIITSIFITSTEETRLSRSYQRQKGELTEPVKREIHRRLKADMLEVTPYKNKTCLNLRNEFDEDLDNCVDFINKLAIAMKTNK